MFEFIDFLLKQLVLLTHKLQFCHQCIVLGKQIVFCGGCLYAAIFRFRLIAVALAVVLEEVLAVDEIGCTGRCLAIVAGCLFAQQIIRIMSDASNHGDRTLINSLYQLWIGVTGQGSGEPPPRTMAMT